ncbi:hypothetical protein AB3X91_08895 [Paraburkholderia sp. BR14263]|uniref:hypothetical protein n=1 Tax=unclassified Paraburkholderia TaxID=2615204 RepID=UPI0034CF6339
MMRHALALGGAQLRACNSVCVPEIQAPVVDGSKELEESRCGRAASTADYVHRSLPKPLQRGVALFLREHLHDTNDASTAGCGNDLVHGNCWRAHRRGIVECGMSVRRDNLGLEKVLASLKVASSTVVVAHASLLVEVVGGTTLHVLEAIAESEGRRCTRLAARRFAVRLHFGASRCLYGGTSGLV